MDQYGTDEVEVGGSDQVTARPDPVDTRPAGRDDDHCPVRPRLEVICADPRIKIGEDEASAGVAEREGLAAHCCV
jgi:hypothetical protein